MKYNYHEAIITVVVRDVFYYKIYFTDTIEVQLLLKCIKNLHIKLFSSNEQFQIHNKKGIINLYILQ